MKPLISLLMAGTLFGLFSCKAAYRDLDVQGFSDAVSAGAALIDVRTPEEYGEGHLRGAVNVDAASADFLTRVESLYGKSDPVYVYCRSGRRSADAASRLSKAGYQVVNLKGGILAWTEAGNPVTSYEAERFLTPGGHPVQITLIKHASLEIRYAGLSIQVDPVLDLGRPTDYAAEFPKADCILVTHEHGDHFDQDAIDVLRKEGTTVVTNPRCGEMLGWGTVLANGDASDLAEGVHVETVPAYNTTEGHLQFHPKGRDNGYVLHLDGLRIYIAGDTEDIPEMADLKDIDIAFLPVNQPYTMTVDQCVRAARTIRPKVLIPYHFSQTDLSALPSLLPGMDIRLRQMQ